MMIDLLLMRFLVGHNADRESTNARIAADHRLSVFRLVFIEAAAVYDARNDLFHAKGLRGIGLENAVKLCRRKHRRLRLLAIEDRTAAVSKFLNERPDACDTG